MPAALQRVRLKGDPLSSSDKVSDVTTEQIITKIPLEQNTEYGCLEFLLSCSRHAVGRIIAVGDVGVGDTIIKEVVTGVRTGSGNTSSSDSFDNIGNFTSGGVGVQELQFLALVVSPGSGSDVDATLGINKV